MTDITVKIANIRDFNEAILKEVSKRFSAKRSQIDTAIREQIGAAVDEMKNFFRPNRGPNGNEDVVGQLGIGFGGRADTDKIDNAYKLLKPGTSSAKLSLSFQRNARNFGKASFSIDISKFYNSDLTTYLPSRGQRAVVDFNGPVPWMQHFIEGLEVQGYEYIDESDPQFSSRRSRTGIGMMIKVPAGNFVFRGVGRENTFEPLFKRIEKKLSSKAFAKKIENILRN